MAPRNKVTVQPTKGGDGWDVKKGDRTVSHHHTKEPAVQRGMREAKAVDHGQLVIRKQDGRIQEERTYGDDPFPPRG